MSHRLNVAKSGLSYRYYFRICLSVLAELVTLPYSCVRFARYSNILHDFLVTIPSSSFPRTASLWNSLSAELFPLTYDLDGFKSRVNRDLLFLG